MTFIFLFRFHSVQGTYCNLSVGRMERLTILCGRKGRLQSFPWTALCPLEPLLLGSHPSPSQVWPMTNEPWSGEQNPAPWLKGYNAAVDSCARAPGVRPKLGLVSTCLGALSPLRHSIPFLPDFLAESLPVNHQHPNPWYELCFKGTQPKPWRVGWSTVIIIPIKRETRPRFYSWSLQLILKFHWVKILPL